VRPASGSGSFGFPEPFPKTYTVEPTVKTLDPQACDSPDGMPLGIPCTPVSWSPGSVNVAIRMSMSLKLNAPGSLPVVMWNTNMRRTLPEPLDSTTPVVGQYHSPDGAGMRSERASAEPPIRGRKQFPLWTTRLLRGSRQPGSSAPFWTRPVNVSP